MAKQTELRKLLDSLSGCTRRHVALLNDPAATEVQRSTAYEIADRAEKRLFSFCDKLVKERDEAVAKVIELDEKLTTAETARDSMYQMNQSLRLTRHVQIVPNHEFNENEARNGEPIQCKVREALAGEPLWHECKFVGMTELNIVVIDSEKYGLEKVARNDLRMKPDTRDVTLYATVYEQGGSTWGALHANALPDFEWLMPKGRRVIGSNIPVKLTVKN